MARSILPGLTNLNEWELYPVIASTFLDSYYVFNRVHQEEFEDSLAITLLCLVCCLSLKRSNVSNVMTRIPINAQGHQEQLEPIQRLKAPGEDYAWLLFVLILGFQIMPYYPSHSAPCQLA